MKIATLGLVLVSCLLLGCSTTPSSVTPAQPAVRSYNGTASVGDSLTISINSTSLTITYKNYTNGETGTVPYTVNADGTYTVTDPSGNLLAAYEVPGFVMMIETAKSGPKEDTPALITAIESVQVQINTFAGQDFNYLQFRTANGGTEIGTITVDAQGNITHDGFSPFEVFSGNPFSGASIPATGVQEDASGAFFTITDSGGPDNYAFGTPSGVLRCGHGQWNDPQPAEGSGEDLRCERCRKLHRDLLRESRRAGWFWQRGDRDGDRRKGKHYSFGQPSADHHRHRRQHAGDGNAVRCR